MNADLVTTRERILRHGLDLMSKSGLSGVTLGLLAAHAGISKSGLFAHFGSKEELQVGLLDRTGQAAREQVVMPALRAAEGLPRLEALMNQWFGWTSRAGLSGGCPVAAALFELDDMDGPVRRHVLDMENRWRKLLAQLVDEAIGQGHLRAGLDVEQFIWELCGIYLSHHASYRFVRDPQADFRAHTAFRALIERARPKRVGGKLAKQAMPTKRSRARRRKSTNAYIRKS